jgi:hypothetical protein
MDQTPQRTADHLSNERTNIIGSVNVQGRPRVFQTVCLQIPKQFLPMVEFVERNNARDYNRTAAPRQSARPDGSK